MQPASYTTILAAIVLVLGMLSRELPAQNAPVAAPRRTTQSSERSSVAAESATALPRRDRTTETPLPPSGNENRRHSATSSPWTTFGVLAVMIVAVVSIARLWKKHGPTASLSLPPEAVEVLGRKMIDQKNVIHLLRVGSRIVIIGASPQGLSTLAEVSDPVEVDILAGLCQRRPGETTKSQSFRSLFNKETSKSTDAGTTGNLVGNPRSAPRQERAQWTYPIHPAAHANEGNYTGGSHE